MTYEVWGGTGKLIANTLSFGLYMDRYGNGMVAIYSSILDEEVDDYIFVTDLPVDDEILTYLTCFSPVGTASQFMAIQDNGANVVDWPYDIDTPPYVHRETSISTYYSMDHTNDISLVYPTTFTNNYKVRWKFRVNSGLVSRPLQRQNVLYRTHRYLTACWYYGVYSYVRTSEMAYEGWTYVVDSTLQEFAWFGGAVGAPEA